MAGQSLHFTRQVARFLKWGCLQCENKPLDKLNFQDVTQLAIDRSWARSDRSALRNACRKPVTGKTNLVLHEAAVRQLTLTTHSDTSTCSEAAIRLSPLHQQQSNPSVAPQTLQSAQACQTNTLLSIFAFTRNRRKQTFGQPSGLRLLLLQQTT